MEKDKLKDFVEGMNWSEYAKDKNLPEQKDSFKVLIVPSSDDEREFEYIEGGFEEAVEMHESKEYCSSMHEFDTMEEAKAFIKGYEAGVGYLGGGYWNADFNLEMEDLP